MDNFKCPKHPDAHVHVDDNSQQRACGECYEELAPLSQEDRDELGMDSQTIRQDLPKPADDGERWRAVLQPGTETSGFQGRSQRQCMNLIREISQKAKYPGLRKEALKIVEAFLKKLAEEDPQKACINLNIAGAAVYIAARKTEDPELQLLVLKLLKENKTKSNLSVQFDIIRKLDLNLKILTPEVLIPGFCRKLDLNSEVEMTATHVASAIKKLRRDLVKPSLLAAIGIYIACQTHENDQYRTSQEVAKALDAPKAQLLRIAKELVSFTKDIFPPTFSPRCSLFEYMKREVFFLPFL